MHYIIKRVPRIKAVNQFGIPYTGNKTWDYKNTRYFKESGDGYWQHWQSTRACATVFEGTKAEACAMATKLKICHTNPNEHEFVGYVEVVLDENGNITSTEG